MHNNQSHPRPINSTINTIRKDQTTPTADASVQLYNLSQSAQGVTEAKVLPLLCFLHAAQIPAWLITLMWCDIFHKNWKTSAVTMTNWMVETQLCKLRGTSFFLFFFTHIYFPASGQAVVTRVVPSFPRFSPSFFIAHRVQQSHCSSIFHQVSVANSRSRAFRKSICEQEKVPTNLYK